MGESVHLDVDRENQRREIVYALPERPLLPSDVSQGRSILRGADRVRRARLR